MKEAARIIGGLGGFAFGALTLFTTWCAWKLTGHDGVFGCEGWHLFMPWRVLLTLAWPVAFTLGASALMGLSAWLVVAASESWGKLRRR